MRFPGRFRKISCTTQLVSYKLKPGPGEPRIASCSSQDKIQALGEGHKHTIPLPLLLTEGFHLSNKCPALSCKFLKKKKKKNQKR